MHINHNWSRHCPIISRKCLQVVRTPNKNDKRPRPKVHFTLWKSLDEETGRQAKPVFGVSLSNGWPIRTEKSMGGTISTTRHLGFARKLDDLVTNCNRSSQQQKELHQCST